MDLLTPHLGLFTWTFISFVIVLFLLKKFAWKPILDMVTERETTIANSIAAAEKVRAEMSSMKAENENLLAQAREERSVLLKEAKETKEKMINQAKDQAKVEADKILVNAKLQIEQQRNAALIAVKNDIGNLAIEVAEKVLRKEFAEGSAQKEYAKSLANEITLN